MTKALILAAGQGSRLRPITNKKPKCLVTLKGISLLQRQVNTLREAGINHIHIATGYKADQIKELGFETSFNENFKKTNMVESLFCALDFLSNCREDLIIGYGDIIYESKNLETVLSDDHEISIMIDKNWKELWSIRSEDPLIDAETLVLDSNSFIKELGKKPKDYQKIDGQYTGLIKVRSDKLPDLIKFYSSLDRNLDYDGKSFKNMYMTSFLQLLIEAGWEVKAVEVHGGWLEIDSVDDLEIYETLLSNGDLLKFISL